MKKNGDCVDYRRRNDMDSYPMPRVDELIGQLGNAHVGPIAGDIGKFPCQQSRGTIDN